MPSQFILNIVYNRHKVITKNRKTAGKDVEGKSRDSSVGIALGYGLDDRGSRVRFSVATGNFFLHHGVQSGSGAHPNSYPMDTRDLSLGVKWPGRETNNSPPSSDEVKECVELYLHYPNTSSWRGA
jgi:hypothetical protein